MKPRQLAGRIGLLLRPPPQDARLLPGKTITITCTPGRSGTDFLHRVFQLFPDFYSTHEPDVPQLQGNIRKALADGEFGKRVWRQKFAIINARPEKKYFESSHLINKGWIEPLLDLGVCPQLVILRRDLRKVATSLLALDTIPARSRLGRDFLLQPDDPGVWQIPGWEALSDYQLCYWYALETERRSLYYGRLIREKGGAVFETGVDALVNEDEEFARLCAFSGVALTEDLAAAFTRMKSVRANNRDDGKAEIASAPEELADQESVLLAQATSWRE